MNRIKFLLVSALAVVAFNSTGCDGGGSSVSKDVDITTDADSPDKEIDGGTDANGEEQISKDTSSDHTLGDRTLVGTRWKLIYVSFACVDCEMTEIDYSDKNIVYEFKGNDKLIITGKADSLFVFDGFKEGEHFYEYTWVDFHTDRNQPPNNLIIDRRMAYTGFLVNARVWADMGVVVDMDDELNIISYPDGWTIKLIKSK